MADIRRQVGNIGVTQYVDPGVQDNSMAQGLAAIGGAALDIDQRIGERALENELTAMRDLYESKSFALGSETDDDSGITPADRAEIGAESERIGVLQRAVQQGTLSNDLFRLKAEAALRAAIARRPGLAQEYRQLAASTLGMDVSGAAIEQLAQAEARLVNSQQAQAEAASSARSAATTQRGGLARKALDANPSADLATYRTMTDDELGAEVEKNPLFKSIVENSLEALAKGEQAKVAASLTTDTLTAGRPGAQAEAAGTMAGFRASVGARVQRLGSIFDDDRFDLTTEGPEVRAAIEQSRLEAMAVKEQLLANSSYLGSDFIQQASRELDDTIKMMDDVLAQGTNLSEQSLRSLISVGSYNAVKGNQAVYNYSIARNVLGPELAQSVAAGDAGNMESMGIVLRGMTGSQTDPAVIMGAGKDAISAVTTYFGTADDTTDAGVEASAKVVGQVVDAAINTPSAQYRSALWAGPTGIVARLADRQGQQMVQKFPETERIALGNKIIVANRRALDAVKIEWRRSGRGDATFELRPDGSFIQPTDPASAGNARALEARILSTGSMIKAAALFTGKPEAEVIQLMNNVRVPEPAPRNTTPPLISRPSANTNVQSVADELRNAWGM